MNRFESLSKPAAALFADKSQPEQLQHWLAEIHLHNGLDVALEMLFNWSLASGYIPLEKLQQNRHYSFPEAASGVVFHSQINMARDGYRPSEAAPPSLQCALCITNTGQPGQENLRTYLFQGMPSGGFFAQHSPFPLYPRHFVLISLAHTPMRMDSKSVSDMLWLAGQLPEYTICSNSDIAGAGASILQHHHYQIVRKLRLPVMDANWRNGRHSLITIEGATAKAGLLNYPFTCCRISSATPDALQLLAGRLITAWKARDSVKNSCNLLLQHDAGGYLCHIFFRCSAARTSRQWQRFKTEGIGIIEVAGETIYPLPGGAEKDVLLEEIAHNGLNILLGILQDNNPVKSQDLAEFDIWLQQLLDEDTL